MQPWTHNDDMLNAAAASFLFREKNRQDVYELLGNEPLSTFKTGKTIYSPQKFRRALGIILSGSADVLRTEDGRQVLLNHLAVSDSFGAAALYGGGEKYVTEVRASSDCSVLLIAGDKLEAMMRRDFVLAENYIRFLSDRIRFLNRRIAGFTGGAAERRLAAFLLDSAGAEDGSCTAKSMTSLAKMLGIGRSSLYRAIDALSETGIITHNGKQIFVTNIDRLKAYCCIKEGNY